MGSPTYGIPASEVPSPSSSSKSVKLPPPSAFHTSRGKIDEVLQPDLSQHGKKLASYAKRSQRERTPKKETTKERATRALKILATRFELQGSFKKMFRNIDEDKSGKMDRRELQQLIDSCGLDIPAEDIDALYSVLGKDSGEIEYSTLQRAYDRVHDPACGDVLEGVTEGVLSSGADRLNFLSRAHFQEKAKGEFKDSADAALGSLNYTTMNEHEKAYAAQRSHLLLEQLRERLHTNKSSIRSTFRQYDEDHNGTLDPEEFKKALHDLNLLGSKQDFDLMVAFLDQENTGGVDYVRFCQNFAFNAHDSDDQRKKLTNYRPQGKPLDPKQKPKLAQSAHLLANSMAPVDYNKLLRALHRADKSKDGHVTASELRQAFASQHLSCDTKALELISFESEANEHGMINYEDFIASVKKYQQGMTDVVRPVARSNEQSEHPMYRSQTHIPPHQGETNFSRSMSYPDRYRTGPQDFLMQSTRVPAITHNNVHPTDYVTIPHEESGHHMHDFDRLKQTNLHGIEDFKNTPTSYSLRSSHLKLGTHQYRPPMLQEKQARIATNNQRVLSAYGGETEKQALRENGRIQYVQEQQDRYKNAILYESLFRDRKEGRDIFSLIRYGTQGYSFTLDQDHTK